MGRTGSWQGKGSWPRPDSGTAEERLLRYNLSTEKITEEEFNKEMEKLNGNTDAHSSGCNCSSRCSNCGCKS